MFPPVELIQSHGLNRVHNLLHFLTIVRTHNETLFLPRNFSLDFAQVVDSVKEYDLSTAKALPQRGPVPILIQRRCLQAAWGRSVSGAMPSVNRLRYSTLKEPPLGQKLLVDLPRFPEPSDSWRVLVAALRSFREVCQAHECAVLFGSIEIPSIR